MRSMKHENQVNNLNDDSTLQVRNQGGDLKLPGSSNDIEKQLQVPYIDDKFADLEKMINEEPDMPADFINYGDEKDSNDLDDLEVNPETAYFHDMNTADFETTQGTFHCSYSNSYNEINSLIVDASQKRSQIQCELNEKSASQDLGFNEILSKFKPRNQTKRDKIEMFMSLLHLTRAGKIQMEQENPENFSEIKILNSM